MTKLQALTATCAVFFACSPPVVVNSPTSQCKPGAPLRLYDDEGVRVGQAATLTLGLGRSCEDPARAVTVTVRDERFENVPSTTTLLSTDAAHIAQITFTPPAVGNYHVVAVFEPNLGVAQRTVMTLIDRSNVSERQVAVPDGARCLAYSLTNLGTVACHGRDHLWLLRDGQAAESVPATSATVSGNTVWLYDNANLALTRFLDDGQQLVKTHGPFTVTPAALDRVLLGGDEQAWLLDNNDRSLVTHVDLQGTASVHHLPRFVTTGTPLRDGTLLTGQMTFGLIGGNNICQVIASSNTVRCANHDASAVGSDADGIWFLGDRSGVLSYVTLSATDPPVAQASQGTGVVGYDPTTAYERELAPQVPVFGRKSHRAIPIHTSAGVQFEYWPTPADTKGVFAREHALFIEDGAKPNQVTVRLR